MRLSANTFTMSVYCCDDHRNINETFPFNVPQLCLLLTDRYNILVLGNMVTIEDPIHKSEIIACLI